MARCQCAGTQCELVRPCLSGGSGINYNTGTGVISAAPINCDQVRPCISAAPGLSYNPATGVMGPDISGAPGNTLVVDSDGLFVPSTVATVTTDCGLTGNGAPATPLAVTVGTWPYPCDINLAGDELYCDSSAQLRTRPRGGYDRVVQFHDTLYPNLAVPAGTDVVVETQNVTIVNPSSCYDAFVLFSAELEVNFGLPPGSGAGSGMFTDNMYYTFNNGNTAQPDVSTQVTKVVSRIIPPGGTLIEPMQAALSRGSGGATYSRIQMILQAWIFNLS